MTTAELISTYSTTGDVISIILCVCLFILIQESMFFASDRNFTLFKRAILAVMIGATANIAFDHVVVFAPEKIWLIYLTRDIYHVTLMAALLIFYLYIRNMVDPKPEVVRPLDNAAFLINCIGCIFDVVSPLLHFGFYRTAEGLWVDSTYLKPFTMVYIAFILIYAYLLLFQGYRIVPRIRYTLISIEIVVVSVILIENCFDSNSYTTLSFLLPIIAALSLIHSNPFDMVTGAMSGEAMNAYVQHQYQAKKPTSYMVMHLYQQSMEDIPKELGRIMFSFWQDSFRSATLFSPYQGIYILGIEDRADEKETFQRIQTLVEEKFPYYYRQFNIDYKLEVLSGVDFAENGRDLLDLIVYLENKIPMRGVYYATEEKKDELKKIHYVLTQLKDIQEKQDLNDPRILVYAQPVKNVKTGHFDTAEALMRMRLPDAGMIFPDMFIPLAEQNGYIHTLSRIILYKTCRAIHDFMEQGYAVTRISVNFSLLELREERFCEEIIDVIRESGIPFEKLAIELTESQSEEDFELVKEKVKILQEYGINFYLDDFGTGYSNFDRILGLNLNVVKFDRSFLLYAGRDKNASFMMEHFAESFEKLGYSVLFEGVEDEEQEDLCVDSHADYLQGYKFSKPIPIEEIGSFLEKQ